MSEIWKAVRGFEGHYEVSSRGRVRSIKRGRRILSNKRKVDGYPRVSLYLLGEITQVFIHVLVAAHFVGECPAGHEVNHKDRDRTNAVADNLEYLTHQKNTAMRRPEGELHYAATITAADALEIYNRRGIGESVASLSQEFGIGKSGVRAIAAGRSWKSVTKS